MAVYKEYGTLTKIFKFTKKYVFNQGLDPDALARWRVLDDMTRKAGQKAFKAHGSYQSSLNCIKQWEEEKIPAAQKALAEARWFWTKRKARANLQKEEEALEQNKQFAEEKRIEYETLQAEFEELRREKRSYEWY